MLLCVRTARTFPLWNDTDPVDPAPGHHIGGTPGVAVSDGSMISDSFGDTGGGDRSEYECDGLADPLPCWSCFRGESRELPPKVKYR